MNPGVVEETGRVAGSAIDALKTTPVVLALVIFNVLYMAGSFYTQIQQGEQYNRGAERWKTLTETAMKYCAQQPQASYRPEKWNLQSEEGRLVELPPLPQPRPADAQ